MDLKCPNCGTPGIPGEGGSVVCTVCGGRFNFVAGEAHLHGVAEFDQLRKRVDAQDAEIAELRKQLAGDAPSTDEHGDPHVEDDEPADQDDDSDDEDDDEDF
ncbi:MAG: hypothetical protein GXY19_15945 [Phycisphaerae bacterium]|nr:hypothetical protein [Phycisphaerae bacterium]